MNTATLEMAAADARPRLVGIAYRMLGSMSDAEDVVQDALVRVQRNAPDHVESPVAYLTTVTTRLAIDHLRSARVRREAYVGPWLPEPVIADPGAGAGGDPSDAAVLADSLSMAFLVALESLSPEERAALLLHDVFGYDHHHVAVTLDRSEAASRKLLQRARQRVSDARPRHEVDHRQLEALVEQFRQACEGGDMDAFLALLTEDASYVADGGAAVKAARHRIIGATRIARLLAYLTSRRWGGKTLVTVRLNGEPALAAFDGDTLTDVGLFEAGPGGRLSAIHWLRNPDKLARLQQQLRPI